MLHRLFRFFDMSDDEHNSFSVVVLLSVLFHVVAIVGIPLVLTLFIQRETFERPETMQLVTMAEVQKPVVQQPEPVVEPPKATPPPVEKPPVKPKPKPQQPKPKPTTPTPAPKPAVEPVQEEVTTPVEEVEPQDNLEDLEALFAAPPVQTSAVTASHAIPNRYLMAIRGKVEPNWKPTLRDSTIQVVLTFTISLNGTLDGGVVVSRGSGNSIIDRQAKRAIELSAPFPSLPNNFKGDNLRLTYTLIPYKG